MRPVRRRLRRTEFCATELLGACSGRWGSAVTAGREPVDLRLSFAPSQLRTTQRLVGDASSCVGAEGVPRGVDPTLNTGVAGRPVLDSLDKAFQLVGVLGADGELSMTTPTTFHILVPSSQEAQDLGDGYYAAPVLLDDEEWVSFTPCHLRPVIWPTVEPAARGERTARCPRVGCGQLWAVIWDPRSTIGGSLRPLGSWGADREGFALWIE